VQGLAGALLKAVGGPTELDLGAAAAQGGDRALDLRVAQLETGEPPPLAPLEQRCLRISATAALGIGAVMAGAAIGLGPLVSRICDCP
jgi:hypothetical protein